MVNGEGGRFEARQRNIIDTLCVAAEFNAPDERVQRVNFLADYLARAGLQTYVLGISGGVDSTTAGRLAQLAVEKLRAGGANARFVAVRLPYGNQRDEDDAQRAVEFIRPDEVVVANVAPAADGALASLHAAGVMFVDDQQQDFILGNIKARQRMVLQYALASARRGLVIGTDHAAESLMGFFTKYGDGGADILPLYGLTKRRVRAVAAEMGAGERLFEKIPTADLETLTPQRPDEDSYGISYNDIDDFLEGKTVSENVYRTIFRFFDATAHKRALPVTPFAT
jgi:NAD+ synthase